MVRRRLRYAGASVTLVALLFLCPAALAAFPGANGKLAFEGTSSSGQRDIYVVNTDGTGLVNLTNDAAWDTDPAWSPDGKRIAWSKAGGWWDIWVMNANGSSPTQLTNDAPLDLAPAWSPDASRIAFDSNRVDGYEIHLMNADGSGVVQLTTTPFDSSLMPSWSPNGDRIAFVRGSESFPELRMVRPDGADDAELASCTPRPPFQECSFSGPDWSPDGHDRILYVLAQDGGEESSLEWRSVSSGETAVVATAGTNQGMGHFSGHAWSPDGRRIAYAKSPPPGLKLVDLDGANVSDVPTANLSVRSPDWQPIVQMGYPRPKGATPARVSLVPAFAPCTSPNRQHGPPLEYLSCRPPAHLSQNVTMGEPTANGTAANFKGHVRFQVIPGIPSTAADEADVRIQAAMSDIRCAGATTTCGAANRYATADYTGALMGSVQLRITDKDSGPFPDPVTGRGPGTAQDASVDFPILCTETATGSSAGTIGSACSIDTTADALVPGIVREKQRANWELGSVFVLDGGPDGDPSTAAGNEPFLVQGIFVP